MASWRLAPVEVLLAQLANPTSVDWIADIWKLAKDTTPFATLLLLALLWYVNGERLDERKAAEDERKTHQERMDAERQRYDLLVERTHNAMTNSAQAMQDLRNMLMPARRERDR